MKLPNADGDGDELSQPREKFLQTTEEDFRLQFRKNFGRPLQTPRKLSCLSTISLF